MVEPGSGVGRDAAAARGDWKARCLHPAGALARIAGDAGHGAPLRREYRRCVMS